MNAALKKLLRVPAARPFVMDYLRTGCLTSLVVMCDRLDESGDVVFHHLVRTVRASILRQMGS